MKYVVLTNFNGYNSNISCDKYGVITLTLTPNRIKETRFRDSYLLRKRETKFNNMYCTIYKKSNNELLYKYTNHMPSNNFNYEVLKIVQHKIPTDYDLKRVSREIGFKKMMSDYYYKKSRYYYNKYRSI